MDEQGKRYAQWTQRYLRLDDVMHETALPALRSTLAAKVADVRADAAEHAGQDMARYNNASKTYSVLRYAEDGMTLEPLQSDVGPKDVQSVLDTLNGNMSKPVDHVERDEQFWTRDPDQDPTGGVWR